MYFSKSHEWIQVNGDIGTVGITDYAQKELGEIVFVELPKVGQEVKMDQETSILESTKAASDVYSPVSGKVVEINEELKKNPAAVNKAAESEGWLFKLKLSNRQELDGLMNHEKYTQMNSKVGF
ncbi:MAG: glycine cleavage system protein H [Chlamydiae bacterium CG10_big_fil_rev_8_21_14_0_10_42_34]|nr:MAG: glycine cleavage system protein H [Chlamydiae bacterium CG10_big_fil_rev_8_21_14_0_10_42_34]